MRVKSYRAKPEPISFTGPHIPRRVGEKMLPSTLDVIVIAEKYYAFNPAAVCDGCAIIAIKHAYTASCNALST